MTTLDIYEQKRGKSAVTADLIREEIMRFTKDFKTSWVSLARALYPIWKDKLFLAWGFDKFEYYTERELGIKKPTAIKLLRSYYFLEQEEPSYLKEDFSDDREPVKVPTCDAVNVLRLAKGKKELTKDDYLELRKSIFEKGKDASAVRKDLTAIIRERKEVNPEEERQQRNEVAIRKLVNAIHLFQKDMEALKLIPAEILKEAEGLLKKLQEEIE